MTFIVKTKTTVLWLKVVFVFIHMFCAKLINHNLIKSWLILSF